MGSFGRLGLVVTVFLSGSYCTAGPTDTMVAVDPTQSTVAVPDGVVGAPTTITVVLRDPSGNPIPRLSLSDYDVVVTAGSPNAGAAIAKQEGNGVYLASYTPYRVGVDTVTADYRGTQLGRVTSTVQHGPVHADSSVATVPTAAAGVETAITVRARDPGGNPIPTGGAAVTVIVRGPNAAALAVTDNHDGTYRATQTPTTTGTDTVAITINAAPVRDSPFYRPVAEPRPPAVDTLFFDSFESTAPLGQGKGPTDARWGDIVGSGTFSVADDAGLPFKAYSGSRVLAVGPPGGAMSHWVKAVLGGTTPAPRDRLYVSLRLRQPSPGTATLRFIMIRGSRTPWGSFGVGGTCPDAVPPEDEFLAANITTPPVRMYTYWLGMHHFSEGPPPVCWGSSGTHPKDVPQATYVDANAVPPLDAWNHVEMELQLNGVGESNGWERIWLNGALVMEHLNVRYRTGVGTLLEAITIDTGSFSGLFYVDDILVTTQRE